MPKQTQSKLAFLNERRHPRYRELLPHWNFLEKTYSGGRGWFDENIFTYLKEGAKEHALRVQRAYRFNHTREVVDLVNKYVFKSTIARRDDAPEWVRDFWSAATLRGDDVSALVREGSRLSSIFGRIYLVVDSPSAPPDPVVSRAQARDAGLAPYAYWVKPQNALDMSFDERGELNWILLYEDRRDDADFDTASFLTYDRYRLWTRTGWRLYEVQAKAQSSGVRTTAGRDVKVADEGEHDLERVPVLIFDDRESDDDYHSPGLIEDIAYLDRAIANYLSNLDGIIVDQTFSQLIMAAQGVLPGDENYERMLEMGTKRVLLYDGEGKPPGYISPDADQAHLVLAVITKIITEIYHSVGLAGERTKMDNAAGIDNSSGVAKAYDFDRMAVMLRNKAMRLEEIEHRMLGLVADWLGETPPEERQAVYPEEFDVRTLHDEFDSAQRLALIEAPDDVRREQMRRLAEKIFPNLSSDVAAAVRRSIDAWPESGEEAVDAPSRLRPPKSPADSRQGRNGVREDEPAGS